MHRLDLRRAAAAFALSAAMSLPAFAHHGWSWTDEEFFELTGTLQNVSFGNPHPVLDVEAADGTWKVELAPPAATTRAGFTAETAKPGDTVEVIGNRSRDHGERRMKAVRLITGGKTYDIYPSRVPTN